MTKNLNEKKSVKSSEMSPVPLRSAGQTTKAYLHQPHRVSQVLQVPAVNLHPIRKKGQGKDPATLSEYTQLILHSFNEISRRVSLESNYKCFGDLLSQFV